MGISSAMAAGVMGLGVNSSKLATISDNIANSATTGYKRASVEFGSLVMNERPNSYDAGGVRASTMRHIDEQGALTSTRNSTDLAISGRGFIPVADVVDVDRDLNPAIKLTRTGSFRPDATGLYRTSSGLALMGVPAQPGGTFPLLQPDNLEPVRLNGLQLDAEATSAIETTINLDQQTATGGAAPTLPLTYYDALGNAEELRLDFTKDGTDPNRWTLAITDMASGADVTPTFPADAPDFPTAGPPSIVFNATGPDAGRPAAVNWPGDDFNVTIGATGQNIVLDIGSAITSFPETSQLSNATRDGAPPSLVVGVEIGEDGVLEAVYDSGDRIPQFKIPVANVQNSNGLRALDGSSYENTQESGDFVLFEAGAGPAGVMVASSLEESTTDIAQALTSLIKTQRAYSSNAKIIQTVDEMLQETTNLKR
jgi:flagellar hook protein FlgE